MKVKVKIFGVQKLVDAMGGNGQGEIDFSGGNVTEFFGDFLRNYGFHWSDFPFLKNWEQNLSITIIHNGEILNKEDYIRKNLQDGDQISFLLHTGCC